MVNGAVPRNVAVEHTSDHIGAARRPIQDRWDTGPS